MVVQSKVRRRRIANLLKEEQRRLGHHNRAIHPVVPSPGVNIEQVLFSCSSCRYLFHEAVNCPSPGLKLKKGKEAVDRIDVASSGRFARLDRLSPRSR